MKQSLAYLAAATIAALTVAPSHAAFAAAPSPTCAALASKTLAGIGYGLSSTWGTGSHPENRHVLAAALQGIAELRACGDEEASISAELIAADAYDDVYPNKPALRCNALQDARKRLLALGDAKRAAMVAKTMSDCPAAAMHPAPVAAAKKSVAFAGAPACSAARALAADADGLSHTWGSGDHPEDTWTLKGALTSESALRACGDERDAISAELIVADAYSDVYPNKPALRCDALRDARRRLLALGDASHAALVAKTLATGTDCR